MNTEDEEYFFEAADELLKYLEEDHNILEPTDMELRAKLHELEPKMPKGEFNSIITACKLLLEQEKPNKLADALQAAIDKKNRKRN